MDSSTSDSLPTQTATIKAMPVITGKHKRAARMVQRALNRGKRKSAIMQAFGMSPGTFPAPAKLGSKSRGSPITSVSDRYVG